MGKGKHKKSIMHEKDGTCYLCVRLNHDYRRHRELQEHHIYPGIANRRVSEAEGLKVYLCMEHHTVGPAAVHNNHDNMRFLQQEGEREYEKTHSREEFYALFGRYYLEEEGAKDGLEA